MSAFDKITKQVQKKPGQKKRILTPQLDSDVSQRSDGPNIFLQSSNQYINNITHNEKPRQQTKMSKMTSNRRTKQASNNKRLNNQTVQQTLEMKQQNDQQHNQIQLIDDQHIPQGEQQAQQNTQFNLYDSYKYYMGQITNAITYPINKVIFIDNNNQDQNIQNRKHFKHKRKTQNYSSTNQYFVLNKISVSLFLYFLHVLSTTFIFHLEFYIYLAIMIISFVIKKETFQNNAQYTVEPVILLVVTILYVLGNLLIEFFMKKKRALFKENEDSFRVYFHDGVQAQWVVIPAANMKAGNVYKIQPGCKFPTDSLLIHSNHSLIQIEENQLIGRMPQTISKISLKQTIVKAQTIVLPLSGNLQYVIKTPQLKNNWIQGQLNLQQPFQIKHNINTQNVVLKGSKNISSHQILCMSLQVGVNSINLKNVQFPYLYKNNEQILDKHSQVLTIKKFTSLFIQLSSIFYVLLSGIGILVGYLINKMTQRHYYLGTYIKVAHLAFYHFTNFIILVPIFVELSLNIYLFLIGKITQSNISKRQFQLSQSQEQNSISQTIGKINIKDYSILPYLNNQFTLITGIQIFKQKKLLKLKKISVKQLKFQIEKINIDNQIFSQQNRHLIKYFMAVSMLSTIGQNSEESLSIQNSIKKTCKEHFKLKLKKERDLISISGPLETVFTGGKLEVIHYFTIANNYEHPYSINFFEIPTEKQKQEQTTQKRVLCIIRGDPQHILMKMYGKKVNMLNQSDKFHQDQGLQVQFVGKFTITYADAEIIKDAYHSPKTFTQKFYLMVQSLMKKIQPMGIIGFQNQFSQQNLTNMKLNPFLNLSSIQKNNLTQTQSIFSSTNLPKMIIINPICQSYCKHPQFQSVNSINRILNNPLLFNFTQQQISQKILYQPIVPQQLIQKLNKQKVLILNGWDRSNVQLMLVSLKQKGLLTISLIQKNDQIYLAKLSDYSVTRNSVEDVTKYTDISVQQRVQTPKTMVFLSIIQLLSHDSKIVYEGMYCIVLTHIIKFLCYLAVQAINMAYTVGDALSLFRLPLYILTEIIILFDILVYLNFGDNSSFKVKNKISSPLYGTLQAVALCIITTFIIIYSSVTPSTAQGTPNNSVFTIIHIHLYVTHLLIFVKLSWLTQINLYKFIVLIVQIIIYYIGIVIISQTSLYQFNGVLRHSFNNKIYLVSVLSIWIFISFTLSKVIWNLAPQIGLNKKQADNKYQQIKRVTGKDNNLQFLEV